MRDQIIARSAGMTHAAAAIASIAVAAALALSASSANATTIKATYRGAITAGFDDTGVFGSIGDLTGQDVTAVYLTNYNAFGASHASGSHLSFILGGPGYSGADIVTTATVTINGHTLSVGGTFFGEGAQFKLTPAFGLAAEVYHESDDFYVDGPLTHHALAYSGISSLVHGFVTSADYRTPLTYALQGGDGSFGGFFDQVSDPGGHILQTASGDFAPGSVTIAAVPEPSVWLLLLTGFGGLGWAMRRNRADHRAA